VASNGLIRQFDYKHIGKGQGDHSKEYMYPIMHVFHMAVKIGARRIRTINYDGGSISYVHYVL
jgi:hypothetical protein